ncbi:MAG TPA: helix-turn-helix transcriptional regulator [Acidothermaceae bacterium]
MAGRSSARTIRAARQVGQNVATWRKLQNLTGEQLAERAGVSRPTIYKLERGDLGVGLGVLLEVLRALGQLDAVVQATDPYETDLGRIRSAENAPQRVRSARS